jgi:hypothetical protein
MRFYMIGIGKFTMLSYRGWNKLTWSNVSSMSHTFSEKVQNNTFNGPVSLTLYNYLFY